jgi:hypothetical protein
MTLYSAIWKDGPLYYYQHEGFERISNKGVALKCLQDTAEFVISEVKYIFTNNFHLFIIILTFVYIFIG